MTTKGAFVKEKLENMARWVEQGIGKENLPVDVIAGITGRSELEASALAGALQSNKDKIAQRNWSGLMQAVKDSGKFPVSVQEVITCIYQQPKMHDKFWRYMELFVEVAEQ